LISLESQANRVLYPFRALKVLPGREQEPALLELLARAKEICPYNAPSTIAGPSAGAFSGDRGAVIDHYRLLEPIG
jgi:hypothetical protein